MKILIVEDDPRVSQFLVRGLKSEGYQVVHVDDGGEAEAAVRSQDPDIVILDRMLPTVDGIEILRKLRVMRHRCKVLMLSALGNTDEKITGLRMGADDYMAKPFAFEELLARILALHRRSEVYSSEPELGRLQVGDLILDLETLSVERAGRSIKLTAKEIAVLELLMSKPKKVFSRERILANVWDLSVDPLTNIVDVYINRLRGKIDHGFDVAYIRTIRGSGYCISDSPED
jgi:two-component system OmpR family response regulator